MDEQDDMLAVIIQGSILTCQHVNMQGEYDFTRNAVNPNIARATQKSVFL